MRESLDELQRAGRLLSEAEELFDKGNYQDARRMGLGAIERSAHAIALLFIDSYVDVREGILTAMLYMPQRFWVEGLRVLEIIRMANDSDVNVLIDLAREAVEIATGIVMYELGRKE